MDSNCEPDVEHLTDRLVPDIFTPTKLNGAIANTNGSDSIVVATTDAKERLLCWGCGEFGQHCQGHNNDVSFRQSEVKQFGSAAALGAVSGIACGASHTVAISDSGQLYAWGNGNSGQLGCRNQQPRWEPTPVTLSPSPTAPLPLTSRVRNVACGSRHTMVVLTNGHVYSFGNNFYAQLGYNFREKNYKENQLVPQLLEFLKHRPVRQVACGDKHSLFLFEDGTVSAVGNNAHGQIGDGGRAESVVPKPVELGENEHVKNITCGPNHNLVITEAGEVYAWGFSKGCGKRRHDVLSPERIPFKGRQVVQVAGGSTHSLALTAGGAVYSWGFGMEGQLGLGSIVMATRPRRLSHTFLEDGASMLACGEAFSAVITVSGRLYMWGKNNHVIEEGRDSLYKVAVPRCLNPQPSAPVHFVACGVWHAAALTGNPDFVPVSEDSESEESDGETESGSSVYSKVSDVNSLLGGPGANEGGTDMPEGEGVEISAPPQATSPKDSAAAQRPLCSIPRGKTKLTIGEFYASSDSMDNSDKASTPKSARGSVKQATRNPSHPPSTKSSNHSKVSPLVIELPYAPVDPESDLDEQPIQTSAKEEIMLEHDHQGSNPHPEDQTEASPFPKLLLNPDIATSVKEGGLNSARSANTVSEAPSEWPPATVRESLEDMETKEEETSSPGRDGVGTRGGGAGRPSLGGQSMLGSRCRTNYIINPSPTVQVSRTPAKNFTLPRERSVVTSRNMDILDASQLLTGSSGPATSTNVGSIPGRPYGMEKGSVNLGYLHDPFLAFASGYGDLDDFDFDDYLNGSPRPFNRDMSVQHVPTVQLEGDFGKKRIEPRYVKRSATFFGALSGQVSRSPTKFFRKPTPSGQLSRTVTPASKTPTIPYTPMNKNRSLMKTPGGGERAKGTESTSRPNTRGLGAVGGAAKTPTAGRSLSQAQRAPSSSVMPYNSRTSHENQDPKAAPKTPVFSSAASWRQRHPDLPEGLFDDGMSQSAPTSSKGLTRRKHVAFADQRNNSNAATRPDKSVVGPGGDDGGDGDGDVSAGTVSAPATAHRRSTIVTDDINRGGGGVGGCGYVNGNVMTTDTSHGLTTGGGSDGHGQPPTAPLLSVTGGSTAAKNADPRAMSKSSVVTRPSRQGPLLGFSSLTTGGSSKKESASKLWPPTLSPRTVGGGPRTAPGRNRHAPLTSLTVTAGQGRSRTQPVASGGRSRQNPFN